MRGLGSGPVASSALARLPAHGSADSRGPLVPRPGRNQSIVAEGRPGIVNGECPLDGAPFLFCRASPGAHQRDEVHKRRNALAAEALARDEARLQLGGIEPARMVRRVVDLEATP